MKKYVPNGKKGNPNPKPIPPEKRFQKGKSGNPKGRPKGIPYAIKQYTATLVAETYNNLINLPRPELRKIARSRTRPMIEVVVAGAICRDNFIGSMHNTETVLDRIIGKVPIKQQLGGVDGAPLIPASFNIVPVIPVVATSTT